MGIQFYGFVVDCNDIVQIKFVGQIVLIKMVCYKCFCLQVILMYGVCFLDLIGVVGIVVKLC